jgi:hypothetical protein
MKKNETNGIMGIEKERCKHLSQNTIGTSALN